MVIGEFALDTVSVYPTRFNSIIKLICCLTNESYSICGWLNVSYHFVMLLFVLSFNSDIGLNIFVLCVSIECIQFILFIYLQLFLII